MTELERKYEILKVWILNFHDFFFMTFAVWFDLVKGFLAQKNVKNRFVTLFCGKNSFDQRLRKVSLAFVLKTSSSDQI